MRRGESLSILFCILDSDCCKGCVEGDGLCPHDPVLCGRVYNSVDMDPVVLYRTCHHRFDFVVSSTVIQMKLFDYSCV